MRWKHHLHQPPLAEAGGVAEVADLEAVAHVVEAVVLLDNPGQKQRRIEA